MANVQPIRPTPSDDTSQSSAATGQSRLLVLSPNAQLVDTVRRAAPRNMVVTHAVDLDRIADQLLSLQPGVLLIDTASTGDAASMLAQLTQHFPELVVVVAGQREDSAALMQLTAAGRIFRFLLTPLSHGQARLTLDAAANQHAELAATGRRLSSGGASEGGSKNYVGTYGALAAGLLVAIGAIWSGVKYFTAQQAPTPAAIVAENQSQASKVPARPDPLQAELAMAKEAFDQARYLEPTGESALDYYRNALALDPRSEAAKAGVRSVVDRVLERAETALTGERVEEAIRSIETARDIDPSHPRLAFLDTQIARERERLKLSQARDVDNRVRTLIMQFSKRMQDGRLIAPAGSSARDTLFEVRKVDPTDPLVAQAARDLNANLTEAARASLAAGGKEEAQAFVNAARELGAAGLALATVERALADASRPPAQVAAEPPRRPSVAAPVVAAPAVEAPAAQAPIVIAKAEPRPAAASQSQKPGPAPIQTAGTVLQAGMLPRTREVPAKYPNQAQLDRTEGWVDLDFTISPEGVPQDLKVRDAMPRRVFDRAAITSVQQWRFQPIVNGGVAVSQPATLRVRFELK